MRLLSLWILWLLVERSRDFAGHLSSEVLTMKISLFTFFLLIVSIVSPVLTAKELSMQDAKVDTPETKSKELGYYGRYYPNYYYNWYSPYYYRWFAELEDQDAGRSLMEAEPDKLEEDPIGGDIEQRGSRRRYRRRFRRRFGRRFGRRYSRRHGRRYWRRHWRHPYPYYEEDPIPSEHEKRSLTETSTEALEDPKSIEDSKDDDYDPTVHDKESDSNQEYHYGGFGFYNPFFWGW